MTTHHTIVFLEVESWQESYCSERLQQYNTMYLSQTINDVDPRIIRDATILSPFVHSQLDSSVLASLQKAEYITTRSTGFDHIHIPTCKERNILVSNVPFYGENTVAEHAFALILALSRKIAQTSERTTRGHFSLEGLRGFDLKGKTLGVVGTGHIGLNVIKMAKGFDMNVIAFDVYENDEQQKKLGFSYTTLENLLQQSDIISLHAPYNEHTHHLINLRSLDYIKRGALLINTARGGLVETGALVKGIQNGIWGGLGLDVLEGEDILLKENNLTDEDLGSDVLKNALQNHYLITHPNVIFTAHNAFNSNEAVKRIMDTTIDNILAFIKNKPQNIVSVS